MIHRFTVEILGKHEYPIYVFLDKKQIHISECNKNILIFNLKISEKPHILKIVQSFGPEEQNKRKSLWHYISRNFLKLTYDHIHTAADCEFICHRDCSIRICLHEDSGKDILGHNIKEFKFIFENSSNLRFIRNLDNLPISDANSKFYLYLQFFYIIRDFIIMLIFGVLSIIGYCYENNLLGNTPPKYHYKNTDILVMIGIIAVVWSFIQLFIQCKKAFYNTHK